MVRLCIPCPAGFAEFRKESIQQGIHERIEDQVRLDPAKVALKTQDTVYTYDEMNCLANSLAAEILSLAGTRLAQAAILLPNTPQMIVAILAALKAHKAYVPLDPRFPKERLRMMMDDSEPVILLTDNDHIGLAGELAGQRVRIINTSRIGSHAGAANPQLPCDPLERAYILYTSGSTGRPKGISFIHRNLLHTTMCLTNRLVFSPGDRVSWLHSASFAASVVDIYCCLMNGGNLYPWDTKTQGFTGLADWLVKERVTTFQWIPSIFRQFLRTVPEDFVFRDIRIVVMASEPLTVREVELFRRHYPVGSYLVNQIGTSESYNYHVYLLDHNTPITSVNVPGGYPVSEERKVVILDERRQELPLGSVGEIGIKSHYMSAGYWRDEALTNNKFISTGSDESPMYLTGDLGTLEPDGCLTHLGRKDSQVKLRGYRVELAEIENALNSAPGIGDCASRVAKNRLGEEQLVACIILKVPGQFSQSEVEHYLELRLPDYMVPRHYMVVDRFPTLPTGKVDRNALPNPFEHVKTPLRLPASKTVPVPQDILNLLAELELNDIAPDSNLLDAGVDSLITAVLLNLVYQRFNVQISLRDFLESPTPMHLANLIKTASGDGTHRPARDALQLVTGDSSELQPRASSLILTIPTPRRISSCAAKSLDAVPAKQAESGAKKLVIIGAGQFGREVFTWATQAIAGGALWRIKGFLDARADALDGFDYEPRIIGDTEHYQIEEEDVFIGAIGNPTTKVKCYSPILERGGRFVNLIHPLANIGRNVQLGNGIVIAPFGSITSDVRIGDHVTLGAFSNVGHDTIIGDWCQISSHCGINGGATCGEGVFIGGHACITPRITVGAWSFVGAGSVVLRDVAPHMKVFGNPALPIGTTEAFINEPGTNVGAQASVGAGRVVVRDVQPRVKVLGNRRI